MTLNDALCKRLQRFRNRLQRLRPDLSMTNVHNFRIACRELLACYGLIKDLDPARRWKPVVKQAFDSLDRLRDLQQMRERLLQEHSLQPALIASVFEKPLRKASARWKKFAPNLESTDFIQALDQTEATLLAKGKVAAKLQAAWERQWDKSLRRVRKYLLAADASDLDSLHRLRISYKELRYLLELQLDRGATPRAKKAALKKWQDELGIAGDFRAMARYARKLELPEKLQQQFLRQAAEHANQCLEKRAAFAAFLTQLDEQQHKYA